ncbi:unnamed protein product [Pieris brassicae]|uniref:Uncharacterized protein n=1 Tax=Pieris brassicae TaxID=7116 RepID=A0A9P0XHQ1_PIEBR|nr:unnamed protein product [Pieris brassicae]
MVGIGRFILLNFLHRRRYSCVSNSTTNESSKQPEGNKDTYQKCRVCLKEGSVPIFGNQFTADISENFRSITDITIDKNDDFPKYLCDECHSKLQNAIDFRNTAKVSDKIFRELPSDTNEDADDFIYEPQPTRKQTKPTRDESYICVKCDKTFRVFEEYTEHISIDHENASRQCPICNKIYKEIYFKRHLSLHNKTQFICDICGKHSFFKGEFTRHRLTHFYHLPFKCTLCPYRGRFPESLKLHMRTHTGEKPYQCTQCPSRFLTKSNLNKHSLTHRDSYEFKCECCGKGFHNKRTYDQHCRIDHGGIKEHVCNICNKAFGYRKQMMKHQLKVHKREKLRSGRMPIYLQIQQMQKEQQEYREIDSM